jgi:hypothetical protein
LQHIRSSETSDGRRGCVRTPEEEAVLRITQPDGHGRDSSAGGEKNASASVRRECQLRRDSREHLRTADRNHPQRQSEQADRVRQAGEGQEAENQIITHFKVYDERPTNSALLVEQSKYIRQTGSLPQIVAADAAFYSQANENELQGMGVNSAPGKAFPGKISALIHVLSTVEVHFSTSNSKMYFLSLAVAPLARRRRDRLVFRNEAR